MTQESWGVLRAVVPAPLADEVAGWIGGESLGVRVDERPDGLVNLEVFVEDRARAERERERLRTALEALGVDGRATPIEIGTIADAGWVEAYQAALQPFEIGSRFVVVPGSAEDVSGGRTPIRLVPGRAFGTGEHPTTRMCVAALEREVEAGSDWLDVGSGSGVLSVVAHLCGAGRVLGIDVDAESVSVALEVIDANVEDDTVEVRHGVVDDEPHASRDGLVVNISERFFTDSAAALASCLRPGGTLIASGFLARDARDVTLAIEEVGFAVERTQSDGEWVAVVARRRRPRVEP